MSLFRISHLTPFLLLGLSCALNAGTDATLSWNHLIIEAEPVEDARVAEAWFTFTNSTDGPVEIVEIKSDCDCLIAQLDKTLYYPGETGLLLATIDIKPGSPMLEKQIQVKIQSGDHPMETVHLTVRVSRSPESQ